MKRITEKQIESHRLAQIKYRLNHPDKIKEIAKNQYEKNYDKIREQQKEYHNENIDRIMERKSKKYLEDPKKAKDNSRKHYTTIKSRLSYVKRRAIKKNRDFNLSLEWVKEQPFVCYYTGIPLTLESNNDNTLSFDRVNSDKGYTKENTVLCCWRINQMKNDLPLDEMYNWMRKALNYKDRNIIVPDFSNLSVGVRFCHDCDKRVSSIDSHICKDGKRVG